MKNLFRLYREPNEDDQSGGKSIYESIMESPDDKPADDVSRETIDDKPTDDKTTDDGKPAKKFAWGDEDRRKSRAEVKDDDEFDLGYEQDVEGKKVPAKAKLKEIRETAKWLHENQGLINSAIGMRDQLTKNPDLAKTFNTWWGKAFENNKYNPEYVTKLNTMLEGKSEQIVDKIEDQTDDIKEMEKDLAELDAESPQAKILKRNINALKATRTQLKDALGTIKTLQEKTEQHSQFRTDFEGTQKKNKEDGEAKQAGELFDSTLGAMTSKEYKLDDEDDAKEFDSTVRDVVASQAASGKINNDDEFVKAIKDASKAVFEKISKRREKIVHQYLKSKGQSLPAEKEIKKEQTNVDDAQSIGSFMADAMSQNE